MKTLRGRTTIEVTTDELNTLNALLQRADAKPAEPYRNSKGEVLWLKCPVCSRCLAGNDEYCSNCGQHIDMENVAL